MCSLHLSDLIQILYWRLLRSIQIVNTAGHSIKKETAIFFIFLPRSPLAEIKWTDSWTKRQIRRVKCLICFCKIYIDQDVYVRKSSFIFYWKCEFLWNHSPRVKIKLASSFFFREFSNKRVFVASGDENKDTS